MNKLVLNIFFHFEKTGKISILDLYLWIRWKYTTKKIVTRTLQVTNLLLLCGTADVTMSPNVVLNAVSYDHGGRCFLYYHYHQQSAVCGNGTHCWCLIGLCVRNMGEAEPVPADEKQADSGLSSTDESVIWSQEVEVCLFHAMLGHKPVGKRI